jgi:hypothetical protein
MKNLLATILVTLTAISLGCGYSSKNYAAPGVTPSISQVSPDNAPAGGAAFSMTVDGSNFGNKAVVNWDGAPQTANTSFVNSNQLIVSVPATLIKMSGTVQITVTNPGTSSGGMYGGGGTMPATSAPMMFTIN